MSQLDPELLRHSSISSSIKPIINDRRNAPIVTNYSSEDFHESVDPLNYYLYNGIWDDHMYAFPGENDIFIMTNMIITEQKIGKCAGSIYNYIFNKSNCQVSRYFDKTLKGKCVNTTGYVPLRSKKLICFCETEGKMLG